MPGYNPFTGNVVQPPPPPTTPVPRGARREPSVRRRTRQAQKPSQQAQAPQAPTSGAMPQVTAGRAQLPGEAPLPVEPLMPEFDDFGRAVALGSVPGVGQPGTAKGMLNVRRRGVNYG
jgi:hypothetical protein